MWLYSGRNWFVLQHISLFTEGICCAWTLFLYVFLELDDGAYNPLWTMRGFTQTFHFWKETRRAQSVPLNAFLTYITLPWWSIAKGMFCTVNSVSNWNLHWVQMIYLSEHSLVARLWWERMCRVLIAVKFKFSCKSHLSHRMVCTHCWTYMDLLILISSKVLIWIQH